MAAASLYKKLDSGYYITQKQQRRRIDGDVSKLRFATDITATEERLLADFSFRTRMVPGTQEIRTQIGHVCFWGSVVYGNGIFMTISPSERHSYSLLGSSPLGSPIVLAEPNDSRNAITLTKLKT